MKKNKNYQLNDIFWIVSKKQGTIEPIKIDQSNKIADPILKEDLLLNYKTISNLTNKESDEFALLTSFDVINKYGTKKVNSYFIQKYLFVGDSLDDSALNDYINKKNLTKEQLVKLRDSLTKAYKKEYKKHKLFDIMWFMDKENKVAMPFIFSLNDGTPVSVFDKQEIVRISSGIKNNQQNQNYEIISTIDVLKRYAMDSINKYSIEEKFFEDGIVKDDRLITNEDLEKLNKLINKSFIKQIEKNIYQDYICK